MKLKVYLTAAGAEEIALGRQPTYYNYGIRPAEGEDWVTSLPEHAILLGEVEVTLPTPQLAAERAKARLEKELQELRTQAYVQEKEVQQRINNLLALPAPTTVADDGEEGIWP